MGLIGPDIIFLMPSTGGQWSIFGAYCVEIWHFYKLTRIYLKKQPLNPVVLKIWKHPTITQLFESFFKTTVYTAEKMGPDHGDLNLDRRGPDEKNATFWSNQAHKWPPWPPVGWGQKIKIVEKGR